MSFTLRAVKVPPSSASLEEAKSRVFDFFKAACRSLPAVMDMYNLHDVVTVPQLRSTVASEFRKNSHITNPKVIDLLLFKGLEELSNIEEHAKQRHHILGQYVLGRQGLSQDLGTKDQGASDFLKNFYSGKQGKEKWKNSSWVVAARIGSVEALKNQGVCPWNNLINSESSSSESEFLEQKALI